MHKTAGLIFRDEGKDQYRISLHLYINSLALFFRIFFNPLFLLRFLPFFVKLFVILLVVLLVILFEQTQLFRIQKGLEILGRLLPRFLPRLFEDTDTPYRIRELVSEGILRTGLIGLLQAPPKGLFPVYALVSHDVIDELFLDIGRDLVPDLSLIEFVRDLFPYSFPCSSHQKSSVSISSVLFATSMRW